MAGEASEIFVQDTLDFNGKEYTIKPPDFKTRGLFVTWLEKSAIDFVRRHKADYGDDYFPALDRLAKKGGAKGFSWGSEAWLEALRNDEGFQELAYLVLKQSHPDITRKFVVDEIWDSPGGKITVAETGDEMESTKGAELVNKIMRILNRPNLPRPAE